MSPDYDFLPKNLFDLPPSNTDWSLLRRLLDSELVRTLYIFGGPGLGKTFSAYHHGRVDHGVFALTMTEDTAASELRGFYAPRDGSLEWMDGVFTTALRTGGRLVINEISHAPQECLSLLYPVLESERTARLTLPTGETVVPAPGFHVVVTDNAPPEQLPAALEDRFDCRFEVREPHPDALAALSPSLRYAAARSCHLPPERRIGLRPWYGVQKLEPLVGLADACRAVFGEERGERIHDALRIASDQVVAEAAGAPDQEARA